LAAKMSAKFLTSMCFKWEAWNSGTKVDGNNMLPVVLESLCSDDDDVMVVRCDGWFTVKALVGSKSVVAMIIMISLMVQKTA